MSHNKETKQACNEDSSMNITYEEQDSLDFNSSNFGVKSNQLNEIIANEILCENNKSSNQEVEGTSEINNNQTTLGQPTTNRGFTNVVSNSNIDSTAINSLINTTSNMNANIASKNNNHPNCPEEYHNLNVQDELNQNFQSLENMDYSAVLRNFDSQMDSLQDKIITLISSEKNVVKDEIINLNKARKKLNELKQSENSKLEKEKDKWKSNFRIVDSDLCKESDILDLDIGGVSRISTVRSTLTKYSNSALSLMFSGRFKLPTIRGRIFIDRNGLAFSHLVNYLRTGKFPLFNDRVEEAAFFNELDFWKIPIYEISNPVNKILEFDPDWCAAPLSLEASNTIVKKHSKFIDVDLNHGIVLCKSPIDVYTPFVEFKITMNIPSRGKSHLFIGLVDKTKYRSEYLISTFWKDSPSSIYWDIWNTKLIKTDDSGAQTGSLNGYGCLCEDFETKIGILYDHKSRSVSFIKNGINQGIAFKNIPGGLYPALDVWFESGTVEINNTSTFFEEKIYL